LIAGVAQVVANAADLDVAAARFVERGMAETFRVDGLANHAAKQPFQAEERGSLDMLHLSAPGTLAVEITAYVGAPPAGSPSYEFDPAAGEASVRTRDIDASRRFWTEALRFADQGGGVLGFPAPLPAWRLRVRLEAVEGGPAPVTVDADGWVLVTVLTTDMEADLGRLEASGLVLRSTPSWREAIGDREAHVALVEGPGGELVELLETPRR
jgi:hypothetical protein